MKSSPVSARLAALAVATILLGGIGTAPVFATSDTVSTAKATQPTESSLASPTTSAPSAETGSPTPTPAPSLLQAPPASVPTPSSSPISTATPEANGMQRPTDGGATMGQAGKQAAQISAPLSRQLSRMSEPTVGEQPPGTDGLPLGLDVSGHQKNVDWNAVKNSGARFAYIKTSEGPWTLNDFFAQQYNGAASVGLIRGGYHFARPNWSSGASQAQVMLESGGGWSPDGITLPPALDIEDNPYVKTDGTNKCYGMSPATLVNWVKDFTSTIKASTGRDAVIYSSYYFWQECLGNSNAFANSNPLWIAAYYASSPWMPGQWPQYTFWQYANNFADQNQTMPATFPGDQNVFNGTMDQLRVFAGGVPAPKAVLGIVPGATAISGKWAGDGKTYVGWFKDAFWCLEMPADTRKCFNFGAPGDKPVIGDWNGDGTATIGIVRGDSWQLTNSLKTLSVDIVQTFGVPSDTPITGDWDGDGKTTIGIFRNSSWQTTNSQSRGPQVDSVSNFGVPTDIPLVGDWNGDKRDTFGVRRNDTFWLTNSQQSPTVSNVFAYGIGTDTAVTGDWDGNGKTSVGILRGNTWQLTNDFARLTVDSIRF